MTPFMYDFECPQCKAITESIEAVGTQTINCPQCNESKAHRIITNFGGFSISGGNEGSTPPRKARSKGKAFR